MTTSLQLKHTQWVAALMAAPFFIAGMAILTDQPLSLERLSSLQTLLVSVLFYPVCEEVIFRGAIQRELLGTFFTQKKWLGISTANCLTNVVFALVHLAVFQELSALLVFFPGLVFGYFLERHRSLIYPIVLHVWYNLASLFAPPLW